MAEKCLYGYTIQSGEMTIDEVKGNIVKKIFSDYCKGVPQYKLRESVDEYLKELKSKGISVKKNMAVSKNMLGKLLTDERYTGNEIYPQIIEVEIFEKAQCVRENRLKTIGKDKVCSSLKDKEKCFLSDIIVCGECGNVFKKYKRRSGRKNKIFVWDCSNHLVNNRVSCQNVRLSEESIKYMFLLVLNRIKDNPKLLYREETKKQEESDRFKAVDREIKAAEKNAVEYETENLIKLIMKRAMLKYEASQVNNEDYYTEKIKNMVSEITVMSEFSEQIFKEITEQIVVYSNNQMKFRLKNGTEIEETIRY